MSGAANNAHPRCGGSSAATSATTSGRKPNPDQHILLIGFMGAGKSTVARKMARWFGKVSYDVDAGIKRMADKTIPEIFAEEGEAGFRMRELDYLEFLKGMQPGIVSCGGGVISMPESRKALRELGFVVFLKVSLDDVYSRISSTESRPLLSGDRQKAQDLLDSRTPLYLECADLVYDTSGKNSGRVAHELGEMLF